ncbi:MAG: DUF167 domain-containing protein [Deltaproteobacteria bacterium]|nr:DUF167 domain-containing protein [Deltaproteobacteria bacterium]MBW2393164.1 DUF167 domain-containing protein [Deltaproteobacteria bacterium]
MPEETGFAFWIHVSPRAKRPSVGGLHGDALRVAVAAVPEAGRANAACVRALAEAFQVPRRRVELDPGSRHRRKRVRIDGPLETLERRFRELAGAS